MIGLKQPIHAWTRTFTIEDIRATLEAAGTGWLQILADVRAAQRASGPERLASLERLALDS
ncbi:MAG: hypothetical protein NT031_06285, partial [Planctomycetota bacterium]|nr:hypothetical protein [Planctomycetota bacterium]